MGSMPSGKKVAGLGIPVFHAEPSRTDSAGPSVSAVVGMPEGSGKVDTPAKRE